jgi:hypothetical protein
VPRRKARPAPARPAVEEHTDWAGVAYAVRPVTGGATTKTYRCPGCDQEIRPGTPHVVVWPVDDPGAGHRRHWHTACWRARDRRAGKLHRARNAPRYG